MLISTRNPDGTTKITPMSSAWALADRVVIGLAGGGQGVANLQRERECVLNLAGEDLHEQVERMAPPPAALQCPPGNSSGYRYEADKFALAGLHAIPSTDVAPPRIAECPLQLEARVALIMKRPIDAWRGNADRYVIAELRVLRVHAHEDVVVPGTQHVDPARYQPLFYLFRHYVGCGTPLGKTFKAEV